MPPKPRRELSPEEVVLWREFIKLRKESKVSRPEIAVALGMPVNDMRLFENGEPRLLSVESLTAAIGKLREIAAANRETEEAPPVPGPHRYDKDAYERDWRLRECVACGEKVVPDEYWRRFEGCLCEWRMEERERRLSAIGAFLEESCSPCRAIRDKCYCQGCDCREKRVEILRQFKPWDDCTM